MGNGFHPMPGTAGLTCGHPPPVIADVALEECLKAVHKQMDAYHVFLVPRLHSPLWLHLFYKLFNFVFQLSPDLMHWPLAIHEPLFVGIALPALSRPPWTLQQTPKLVGTERQVHGVSAGGEANGRDLLRKLLQILRRLTCLLEDMACKVLQMSGGGEVSVVCDGR
jgi:hypothetical protein